MRTVESSPGRPVPGRPDPRRSKKSGPVAAWRTDLKLKIIGVTRRPGSPLRALPVVGQKIARGRSRRDVLVLEAHREALRGNPVSYSVQLLGRDYTATVFPRFDRFRKIAGVRGVLRLERRGKRGDGPVFPELIELKALLSRRQRNSFNSALRSLELAKVVADSSRINAEILTAKAALQEKKALEAQRKAEAEERRSRLLADAGAVLDSTFELNELMDRVSELLVRRIADWCAIHLREGEQLQRATLRHRNSEKMGLLAQSFPEVDDPETFRAVREAQSELLSGALPQDLARIVPSGERTLALKKTALQSLIRSPIKVHGQVIGLLTLGSEDPSRFYDRSDVTMAENLADRIGLSRESSRLYAEAQREIAHRKEIEARIRVFNTELERRVKERTSLLEEATREANSFAYTVAHDLRAPLRAITGFCHALREDYSAAVDATGQDYLQRIVTGAKRMDDLIRDLLDYARLNRAEIQRSIVDLDELLEEALLAMAHELRERNADVQWARPLGRVVGQGPILVQTFTNLVSNAVKFVESGVKPEVRIRAEPRGARVRVIIEDNGIGIAPEHQERIFGIFERLNHAERYPGTGIGLAIVRRAVERLGGAVGVESQAGQGSRFWVELPSV